MDRQEMFQGKRWGLFNHFLCVPAGDGTGEPCSPEEWNARVDAFDVELPVSYTHLGSRPSCRNDWRAASAASPPKSSQMCIRDRPKGAHR